MLCLMRMLYDSYLSFKRQMSTNKKKKCTSSNYNIYIYTPKQTKTLPIIFNCEKLELFPLKSESKETLSPLPFNTV